MTPNGSLNDHVVVFHRAKLHAAFWAIFTSYIAAQFAFADGHSKNTTTHFAL